MLKIIQRIRRKLIEEGNLKRYLLYAVGEVLLIVIGILLALQLNTWNEARKLRIREINLLSQLDEVLSIEIADLGVNMKAIRQTVKSIEIIQNHLEQNLPYHDSLDLHFGNSAKTVGFIVKAAVYENLKSTGLDIISSDSIRNEIVRHYDYQASYLKDIEQIVVYPFQSSIMEPSMISKFDYAWIFNPASPNNYEDLTRDKAYLSTLKTNREIKSFQLRRTEDVLKSARRLKRAIDIELKKE